MRKPKERGVALVELVLAVMTIGFVVMLIANLPSAVSSINRSRRISVAKEITNRKLDSLRKQGYTTLKTLAQGTNIFTDTALSSLPSPTAVYELSDCPVEVCSNGEQVLQVKARVDWNELGYSKTVELTTLVGQGGIGQ